MIHNYNQFILNESLFNIDSKKLEQSVKNISEKMPDSLLKLIIKYMDKLGSFVRRFTTNGVINVDKLIPLVSVKESVINESNGWGSYIKHILSKLIPKKLISAIWDFIKWVGVGIDDLIIEPIRDREYGQAAFGSFILTVVAFFIWLLGFMIHMGVDQLFNGMENGVVQTEVEFEPEHTQIVTQTISNGKTTTTTTHVITIPDTWSFNVKDVESDRIETWSTTDEDLTNISLGDTLNEDDYSWSFTVKK